MTVNGFFEQNDINTVFVFGGTNDSWEDAPLREIKYDDFTKEDLYFVLPAICYFFKAVKETLPQAEVYCLINTELKPEISKGFEKACEEYGITKIVFEGIDKQSRHPTIKGMQDIKNAVLKVLNRE